MSDLQDQPLTSRLRALALQTGPDQNWIQQTMEDAIQQICRDNERITELKNRLNLAVGHLGGGICPKCDNMNSVVTGCSGSCCVLCDWVDDSSGEPLEDQAP